MKFSSPESRAAKAREFRPSNYQEVMREKHMTPYIRMKCGHLTTREEIESNSAWQAKRGRYYCCNCGKWVDKMPEPKPERLPDEPLF